MVDKTLVPFLPVLNEMPHSKASIMFLCIKCGSFSVRRFNNIFRGAASSCAECGMLRLAPDEKRLYKKFSAMRSRCNTDGTKDYRYYGARGIRVEFGSFTEFKEYMESTFGSDLYAPGIEIDRIDNDGNYAPGNLRLVSHVENCQNTRKVVRADVNYMGTNVPVSHVWHILRYDFPWWKHSKRFCMGLIIKRKMTIPEILLMKVTASRRLPENKLAYAKEIVALYRPI